MLKPIIAVDIDDVLAIENEAVREFANQRYGHAHKPEDYLVDGEYWGYWEYVQGVDEQEGKRRYGEYMASGLKGHLKVMDGALEALTALKQQYDLVVVTSREAHLVDLTHDWLVRHFPGVFNHVEFVAVWTGDTKGSKAVVCSHLNASYLIDDNPEHLLLAAEAGIKGILFGSYGWSSSRQVPETVDRAANWQEVREIFDV